MKFQNVVQTTCLRSVQSNKLSNYHLPQTNEKGENLFFSHIIFQSENIFQLHLLKKITQLNKKTGLGNLNKKSFTALLAKSVRQNYFFWSKMVLKKANWLLLCLTLLRLFNTGDFADFWLDQAQEKIGATSS